MKKPKMHCLLSNLQITFPQFASRLHIMFFCQFLFKCVLPVNSDCSVNSVAYWSLRVYPFRIGQLDRIYSGFNEDSNPTPKAKVQWILDYECLKVVRLENCSKCLTTNSLYDLKHLRLTQYPTLSPHK
jgi:hypothetical protein